MSKYIYLLKSKYNKHTIAFTSRKKAKKYIQETWIKNLPKEIRESLKEAFTMYSNDFLIEKVKIES